MQANIEIVGLGSGDMEQLPLGVYRTLKQTEKVIYTRTLDHPVIEELIEEGVRFQSFDHIYEANEDFDSVYKTIVKNLLEIAKKEPIIYTVPGHTMLAEKTVQLLLANKSTKINITGGQSYLDAMFTTLQIDPIEGLQFMDSNDFDRSEISYQQHMIFCQVYDAFTASEVKLTLLEDLPADYEITIVKASGTANEKKTNIPLEQLDRLEGISNLTSVYVPPVPDDLMLHSFRQLRHIIHTLRGPGGCPWDKKQTHMSLRKYLLEETYELLEAIEIEDDEAIIEELGDVLLQVMLHSQIGEDDGYFSVDDVIERIARKMIHRHPHVFGNNEKEKTWDELKAEEKQSVEHHSLLENINWLSPALEVAESIQRKTAKIGFDWENKQELWDKFSEEKQEFIEALENGLEHEAEVEFGDILFVLANIARHEGIQPEIALNRTNKKFYERFSYMEESVSNKGKSLSKMTFKELNTLWNDAKEKE